MGLEQGVCELNREKKEAEDRASLLELEKTRLEKEVQMSKKELKFSWYHLSSSQEVTLQLQKELALYSKHVDELKRDYSSHSTGGQRSLEKIVKLLQEFNVSIHCNNSLSDQPHSQLSTSAAAASKPSSEFILNTCLASVFISVHLVLALTTNVYVYVISSIFYSHDIPYIVESFSSFFLLTLFNPQGE